MINNVDVSANLPSLTIAAGVTTTPENMAERLAAVIGYRGDWFNGVQVMYRDTRSDKGYWLRYEVELGNNQSAIAFRYMQHGDVLPDINRDTLYMRTLVARADRFPTSANVADQTDTDVYLTFVCQGVSTLHGHYSGSDFARIRCTQPPTNAAIVSRINRKRQK
jgi:hypothetical protein